MNTESLPILLDEYRAIVGRCRNINLTYFEFLTMDFEVDGFPEIVSCLMAKWMAIPHLFLPMIKAWIRPSLRVSFRGDYQSILDFGDKPNLLQLSVNAHNPEIGMKTELIGYALNLLSDFTPCFSKVVYGFESPPVNIRKGFYFDISRPEPINSTYQKAHNLISDNPIGPTLEEFSREASAGDLNICLELIQLSIILAQKAIGFTHFDMTSDNIRIVDLGSVTTIYILDLDNTTPLIDLTGIGDMPAKMHEIGKFKAVKSRYRPVIMKYGGARAKVSSSHLVYSEGYMEFNPDIDMITLLESLNMSSLKTSRHVTDMYKRILPEIRHPIGSSQLIIKRLEDLAVVSAETGTRAINNWTSSDDVLSTSFKYNDCDWEIRVPIINLIHFSLDQVTHALSCDMTDNTQVIINDEFVSEQLLLSREVVQLYGPLLGDKAVQVLISRIRDMNSEINNLHDNACKYLEELKPKEVQWNSNTTND